MRKKHLFSFLLVLGFILGIKDGYIALWRSGEPEPAQVFRYRASMLPKKDQQALQNGIRIEKGSDLARLLEDYLS